ncbi:MAG: glycosyltransferase [Sphingobacteriaceae bacterium]|nr:glycosyltransferase [Sphingobacteriaceae bacterium]
MRILIYWEQAAWGGVDSHLLTLLNTWPSNEDEVVLVYNKGNKGFDRIFSDISFSGKISFLPVTSFSYNEVKRKVSRGLFKILVPLVYCLQPLLMLLMALRMLFVFKKIKGIDVVFADNGGYPGAHGCMAAIIAAKWSGIKGRLLMIHHAASKANVLTSSYEKLLDRYLSGCIDTIICPSFATRQSIFDHRFFNEENVKFLVIPNGVLMPEKPITTSPFKMPDNLNCINVCVVGRIEKYKGHEDIMQAMSMLPEGIKRNVQLYIIGAGDEDYIDRLKRLCKYLKLGDQVVFTGYVEGNSISIIQNFDLLISATRTFEGFGLSIAEALSVEVPVIATSVGAVSEAFAGVVSIVPSGSAKEMSGALLQFYENRDAWKVQASQGKLRIQTYSEQMAKTFHDEFAITCQL